MRLLDWRDSKAGKVLALRAADLGSVPRTAYGPLNPTGRNS